VVDLGPEGGDGGGRVIAAGTPEDVAQVAESYTGQYLRPLLRSRAPAGSLNGAAVGQPKKRRRRVAEDSDALA